MRLFGVWGGELFWCVCVCCVCLLLLVRVVLVFAVSCRAACSVLFGVVVVALRMCCDV